MTSIRRFGSKRGRTKRRARILSAVVAGAVALFVAVLSTDPTTTVISPAVSVSGVYTLTGHVVHVADGDTFTLNVAGRRERVRLASIDAPETFKSRQRPGQPAGQASKRALALLVNGKTLSLSCFEHDHYGRNVCDVPLSGRPTANRELVAMGMAWANMQGHGKYMRDPEILKIEAQARRNHLGIWQESAPVQPWVWRYQCWRRAHC